MNIVALLNSIPGAIGQGLIWGVMAIGVYVSYKILDYADLTVDGSFCTGGAVCAVLIVAGVNPAVALLASIVAGMIAGLFTGLIHTVFGIPAILSGILMQLALYSINLRIMGKANVTVSRTQYDLLLSSRDNVSAIFVAGLVVAAVVGILYWFFGTELGCAIRATGNNERMSRAQGINTNMMKVIGLVLSNGIVGLAGGVLTQYQGNADINMGRGAIVIGLAAVVIGGIFNSKSSNFAVRLSTTAAGGIVYYLVIAFVLWLGLDTQDLKLFSALIVFIFLAIPYVKKNYLAKSHLKGGK